MRIKRGKSKYIVLALGNLIIMACILILYASYAKDVRSDKAAAAHESFTAAVKSAAYLSYGVGMSRDFMKNMYQTFIRAADSRIDKVKGFGLGLAITKHIVCLAWICFGFYSY